MNKKTIWLIVGLLICVISIVGCGNIDDTQGEVKSTELLRTSQSWNEVELPDYPQGRPELVAVKYIIPPGKKLGWHHHVAMNHGVLVQGELTIIAQDGKTKVMRAGEVVVEMVDAIHHGENRGTEPVVLYMFYLSQKDMPLSVQHPEIPLE
jgi:quercetin dioxygenase-like cupin family protein